MQLRVTMYPTTLDVYNIALNNYLLSYFVFVMRLACMQFRKSGVSFPHELNHENSTHINKHGIE